MSGTRQVHEPEQENRPSHEARQKPRSLSRPRSAHCGVCDEDQWQRRKDDERCRRVEEEVRDQPDFVGGSETVCVVESEPSAAPAIASRIGLNSSIGMGNTMVVFFS